MKHNYNHEHQHNHAPATGKPEELAVCPVMGISVNKKEAEAKGLVVELKARSTTCAANTASIHLAKTQSSTRTKRRMCTVNMVRKSYTTTKTTAILTHQHGTLTLVRCTLKSPQISPAPVRSATWHSKRQRLRRDNTTMTSTLVTIQTFLSRSFGSHCY